ncbi:MAG: 1-deoxy-D-xylulose-5-phosphate synthase [Candidatus Thiodiazotropha sp. DIVDIV]
MSDQGTTDSISNNKGDYPILNQINSPGELRQLDPIKLRPLAAEMRRFLIDSVSQTGGHLAAGLGVVELTIALHYVFNTPYDRLVWDVGHQAYPHKILTGRRERMGTLRKKGGLSGFPKRSESEYDTFGTGHSSTSIGAALGMAVASKQKGENRKVVAVIGDGAMGAGMAFEALNQAGALDQDLLVILNDNDMSISKPVGGFSNHLARLLSGKVYTSMREGGKSALSHLPHQFSDIVGKWEEHMKGMVMPGTLFEEMGFNYIGPIEGHDFDTLIATLHNMRHMRGPRLLHIVTQKGRGYVPAEQDPCVYHGVTPFDPATGKMEKGAGQKTYTQVFGDWLCHAAEQDERLVAITPAMSEGSGMVEYAKRFSQRYFDVGIAEQHALTFAAGLACEGMKPVVAIYSTFLQRAYDQLIHDVALQNLDVTLAVDRAGQVGADGATHAGCFDLSYSRSVPNMVIMAPGDENECARLLQTGFNYTGPALIRYPRGAGPGVNVEAESIPIPIGESEIRRRGKRIALLVFGSPLSTAHQVADQVDATLINMRFIKPLDENMVRDLAKNHETLVTIEENVVQGGAGSAVNEFLASEGIQVKVLNLGLPDRYLDHASHQQQLAEAGLDYAGILSAIERGSRESKLQLV